MALAGRRPTALAAPHHRVARGIVGMARRRGSRGANRRRRAAEGQPQPSAAIDRLDGCTLAVVADFCSLQDCCALRHRISKRTSQQLAPADASEAFARARVLRLVERWWRATLLPDEQQTTDGPRTYYYSRRGARGSARFSSSAAAEQPGQAYSRNRKEFSYRNFLHHLHVLLRARSVRTLRLGGLPAFYEYSGREQDAIITSGGSTLRFVLRRYPIRPASLKGLDHLERLRKLVKKKVLQAISVGGSAFSTVRFLRRFSQQRFSEFLALDKALRRGTQRPRDCLVGPWRFLEQSLTRDYCPCCDRFRDQRRPEFHGGTTRRGPEPCPACELMPWARALKRYRLTPEQLPRDTAGAVTWHRRNYFGWEPGNFSGRQPKYFRVPMVLRRRAEEVARRVWGDDGDRRAARATARAKKKRRRRQRDAAARRKAHTKVRGSGSLSGGIPQFGDTVAVWSIGSRLERRVEGAGDSEVAGSGSLRD